MSSVQQKLLQLSILNNYDEYEPSELIEMLKVADDCYYNTNSAVLSDVDYDSLRLYAKQINPYDPYFNQVGVQVRTGKTKLPFSMGSLDQLYNNKDIQNWLSKNKLYKSNLVITEKLDGVSGMILFDGNGFTISYSRGDGVEGAIIDRHITKMKSVPLQFAPVEPTAIRGEIIFSKRNFTEAQKIVKTRNGEQYKNARNCIAGLMNAEQNDARVYDYIDFVAYQVVNDTRSKQQQLQFLVDNGFKIPNYTINTGDTLDDVQLAQTVIEMKERSSYELDGIVIDIDDSKERQIVAISSKDTLNPPYAIKYKVAGEDNCAVTSVVDVEWSRSKHGYLKPVVIFEPVNLCGVTITRATAFNAAFIWTNNIGIGSKIEITRSGDVIPFIKHVVTQTTALMPVDEWEWNETGVDAVVIEPDKYADVQINRIVDFFTTLNVAHLKEGSVSALYEKNYNTVEKIINMSENNLIEIIGENGRKIYESMQQKLSSVQLYELIGAYSTARGIGVRKMKKLQQEFGTRLIEDDITIEDIVNVDSFDVKTANQVIFCLKQFKDFLSKVHEKVTFVEQTNNTEGYFKGKCFVFTGFRDTHIEKIIEQNGGTVASGVSKKVTTVVAKDVHEKSSKIQKAQQLGIHVISLDTLNALIEDNIQ